jgi:hypothetical protein
LEEVGTQSNVFYLTKVRNVEGERIPPGIGHGAAHGDAHEDHDEHGANGHEEHTEAAAHTDEHSSH